MVFDPGALGTLRIGLDANSRREQTSSRPSFPGSRRARRGVVRRSVAARWRRVVAAPVATDASAAQWIRGRDPREGRTALG